MAATNLNKTSCFSFTIENSISSISQILKNSNVNPHFGLLVFLTFRSHQD